MPQADKASLHSRERYAFMLVSLEIDPMLPRQYGRHGQRRGIRLGPIRAHNRHDR